MGYYSEVGLVVSDEIDQELRKDPDATHHLDYADEHLKDDSTKAHLYHWQNVKWRQHDEDEILCAFKNMGDEWYYVRIGEDYADIDMRGEWWENPFNLCIRRELEFCGRDVVVKTPVGIGLKSENTKPGATHCANCGGALKDPGLGSAFKHCPTCEP